MSEQHTTPLQAALEAVAQLSYEEKEMLFEIAYRRLIEERRSRLAADVAESREAYRQDQVGRGTADDLIKELEG
jgi:hypothetical protein